MKKLKLFIIVFLSITSLPSFSQNTYPVTLKELKDDMTGTTLYSPSKGLTMSRKSPEQGYTITPNIEADFSYNSMMCEMWGLGKCSRSNSLIIMFADSSKIISYSGGKLNCKGFSFFVFEDEEIKQLSTKKLLKIRLTNGESSQMMTAHVWGVDQSYFIDFYKSYSKKRTELKIEDKKTEQVVLAKDTVIIESKKIYGDEILDFAIDEPKIVGELTYHEIFYFKDNIKYPKKWDLNYTYHVQFNFVVNKDGSVCDLNITTQGLPEWIPKEITRIFYTMPKWEPGYMDNQPVRVRRKVRIKV